MFTDDYYCVCRNARRTICTALSFFEERETLADQIATLADDLSAGRIAQASVEEIYRFQYRKHFGRDPGALPDPRVQTIFSRIFAMCRHQDIDIATYITANMHGMRFWLSKNKGKSFQPNMLSGPKALNRYRVYCEIANRRLQGAEDGLDGRTELGKLRADLAVSEELVGRRYVSAFIHGHELSMNGAIDSTDELYSLSEDWHDVRSHLEGTMLRYDSRVSCYPLQRLQEEYRLAQLTAAAAVGDTYVPHFRTTVGVATFKWRSFAALMAAVRPKSKRRRLTGNLPHVRDGMLAWGALA